MHSECETKHAAVCLSVDTAISEAHDEAKQLSDYAAEWSTECGTKPAAICLSLDKAVVSAFNVSVGDPNDDSELAANYAADIGAFAES